jgi:hypothetical protein
MGRAVVTERDVRQWRTQWAQQQEMLLREKQSREEDESVKQQQEEARLLEDREERDFEETDRRYDALKRQYRDGNLSAEQLEAQLKEIMVQDRDGNWWVKHTETGEWYYYDGSTWVQRNPPDYEYEPTTVQEQPLPAQEPPPPVREQPPPVREQPRVLTTTPAAPPAAPPGPDDYMDRLLKYIPAESVALYLTLQGIILSGAAEASNLNTWLWFILVIGLIGTALYQWRVLKIEKLVQLAVSTTAFGVWVFALGGAFVSLSWYEPFIGSLTLVIFTFFAPLISPDVLSTDQE